MSLKDDLTELADKMRAVCDGDDHLTAKVIALRLLTAELRGIAKGLPDAPAGNWNSPAPAAPARDPVIEMMKHREAARLARQEEAGAVAMRDCKGGPADGCTVPAHPDMPPGARCMVAGAVYELGADGVLVYQPKKG